MMSRLRYLGFKWRAIAMLVAGRRESALALFEAMLQEFPDDRYALASRAHLQTQLGNKRAGLAAGDHLDEYDSIDTAGNVEATQRW